MTVQELMDRLSRMRRDMNVILTDPNDDSVTYDIASLDIRKDWDETVVALMPDLQ